MAIVGLPSPDGVSGSEKFPFLLLPPPLPLLFSLPPPTHPVGSVPQKNSG